MNAPKGSSMVSNGCPTEGPSALHIVIVDSTDLLPEPAKKQVEVKILSLAKSLGTKKEELLEIRTIDDKKTAGNILFSRCSPSDGTLTSDLTGNPVKAKRKWAEEFIGPLEKIVADGFSNSLADHSPLLETLQSLGVESLEPFGLTGHSIDLLIISDMRQYSDNYSQYTGDLSYQRYHESPAYRKLHTNLGNASISILYIQRSQPKIDEIAHVGFWNEWATDNGASLVSIERLQGEN
jgi:hypothetical protein